MNNPSNNRLDPQTFAQRLAALSPEKRAALEKLLQKEKAKDSPPFVIPKRNTSQPLPLSFAQQRLWFLDRFEPGLAIYNIPLALRMLGRLNQEALERSLREIAARHEALRTTFAEVEGQPAQVIATAARLAFEVVTLNKLSKPEREAEVQRRAAREARQAFDLARGPLFRASLLRLGADEHVLLLTFHHIVIDGWSLSVFVRELTTLYSAFAQGLPSPLPEPVIQYADYAIWQRQRLQGETLEAQLAYWKHALANAPPSLELPSDRRRPAFQSFHGGTRACLIPKSMMTALAHLSRREGVTLFMTLLAAFNVLLHRYSGQEDILVGTPAANRDRPEIEGLIGFFINTLVLRTDLRRNPAFRELLARVREVAVGAYDHQELPFEKLVEELHPPRDLSRAPIFQVMFGLQDAPNQTLALSGLKLHRLKIDYDTAMFDVSLFLWKREEGLIGVLEYNADLFEAGTARRMLEDYQTLLKSIVAHPEQRLSELPLLSEAKRRQLLFAWNDTAVEYPNACLRELFEAQAERAPDAIALMCEEQSLTYRELNRRANQVAHHLSRHCGIGPEVKVGICVERSLEMVVGLLGILKAGGAYVPLDPAYPAERIEYVLQDAKVAVLVTQKLTIENCQLAIGNFQLLCLDSDWDEIARARDDNPAATVFSENLAYTIYTSGSTGKPKGVAIPQRALTNFLCSMLKTPGFTSQDVLLAVTTLSFDIAGLELYLPLLAGGRVVLADQETTKDARALCDLLASSGATVMQATPATWRMLLEAGWRGDSALKILCGGEALPTELAQQLLESCGALWNMYGPTETTIWSGAYPLAKKDESAPFGRPIANTQLYVLDAHMQPAPLGVPGELHIGGEGLARGYVNRPELSAEKFAPNPFAQQESSSDHSTRHALRSTLHAPRPSPFAFRLYKTGDLVRYRPNGSLEFLGRLDHQVKLRGFRIELGEIEAVLGEHEAVRQGLALVREDAPGDQRLTAYVVLREHAEVTLNELQSFARKKLPEYMVPTVLMQLEKLPLTPNGKVDRRALPAPEHDHSGLAEQFVAPRSPIETELAELWQKLLRAPRVGRRDNFFALGGHSLLVTQLLARVRAQFGVEVAVRDFFKQPTLAEIALLVEDALLANASEEKLEAMLEELEGVAA